jgi:hypothetical protein
MFQKSSFAMTINAHDNAFCLASSYLATPSCRVTIIVSLRVMLCCPLHQLMFARHLEKKDMPYAVMVGIEGIVVLLNPNLG